MLVIYLKHWFLLLPVEEQERQERNRSRQPPKEGGEDSANLDFMLALSLQNESQAPSVAEQEFWGAVCEADPSHEVPSAPDHIKGRFVYFVLVSVSTVFCGVFLSLYIQFI